MKKQILFILLFLFISLLKGITQTTNQHIEQVENGLIPYVPVEGFAKWNIYDRMKYHDVQGVSIAIIRNFKIEWVKAYGMADTAKKVAMTPETMLSAGSISKMVMGFGAMQLVQNQKLALDEPINNYLKSWQLPDNDFTKKTPVTLRLLLSHKAGTSQQSYWGFTPDVQALPTILDVLKGNPIAQSRGVNVVAEPNQKFEYSGGGSMVAQMAIMDASGEGFDSYIKRTIFDPLSMQHSTFAQPLPTSFQKYASWGYSRAAWYKGKPYIYPQQAAAGLYTTPTDLAKFVIEIQKAYQGKSNLLSQNLAKTMLTPQATISEGSYKEQIGLSPFLLQRSDNQEDKGIYFEHTGVNAGFTAYAIGNLTEGYGAVIMLNSGDDFNGLGFEIRRAIAQTYNWYRFLPEPVKPVKLSEEELDKYVGRYRRGDDEVVEIRREKGYLVEIIRENLGEGKAIYCFPIGNDSIVFTDFNVKGVFGKNTEGSVISLKSEYQTTPMMKMTTDEFAPHELLKRGQYAAAKAAYRALKPYESQITYIVYAYMAQPNFDKNAAKTLLELAAELYPTSNMVDLRWGDYWLKLGDKTKALTYYKKVQKNNPSDENLKKEIEKLE